LDRTRSEEKIYRHFESKDKIGFSKQENQTFITLTNQGQTMSQERLMLFRELDNRLKSFPSLQDRDTKEKQSRGTSLARSLRTKPREMIDAELIADRLIKSISDWQ
jgi:hypothetical protein